LLICITDNGEPQESGITGQADRVWENHQALGNVAEPAEFRILLPVREGRGCGEGPGEIEGEVVGADEGTEVTCRAVIWRADFQRRVTWRSNQATYESV
jgi:hypothetical protein